MIFVVLDRLVFWFLKYVVGGIWKLHLVAKGVIFSKLRGVTVIGKPIVRLAHKSQLKFGRNVVLMSSSKYCYSGTLYSNCKFQTITRTAKIIIGDDVSFNGTSVVCRSTSIFIGSRTMFGPNVTILDSPFHPVSPKQNRNHYPGTELDKPIYIGEDVWIGSRVIVLPGSKIGDGSVIGAGSVVSGLIPENVLAIGSPAIAVKNLV
jgi:acetyltransferase-like isoleucine patch superfamily enzyme